MLRYKSNQRLKEQVEQRQSLAERRLSLSANIGLSAKKLALRPVSMSEYKETRLRPKRKLIVYKKDGKFFINDSAAYALNLVDVEKFMSENSHLIEIGTETLNGIQNDENIEVKYVDYEKDDKKTMPQSTEKRKTRPIILDASKQNATTSSEQGKRTRKIILDDYLQRGEASNSTKNRRTRRILLDACASTKLSDLPLAKEALREGLEEHEKNHEGRELWI